jgi:high-affinity nickel permease
VALGFFFSFGHSTIVLALMAGLAVGAKTADATVPAFQHYGGYVSAGASGMFLNLIVFAWPCCRCRSCSRRAWRRWTSPPAPT